MTNINNWNKNNILKFSIDHTSLEEDLFDFPVLLNITESSGKNNYDCSTVFDELTYENRKKIALVYPSVQEHWVEEYDNYTTLLIQSIDAPIDSTTFTDKSKYKNTITSYTNAHHSGLQPKFGTSSIYFNGVNSYLQVPYSDLFSISQLSIYTIEFWIYLISSSGMRCILGKNNGAGTGSYSIYVYPTQIVVTFSIDGTGGNGVNRSVVTENLLNSWHHFAFVFNSGTLKIFQNGVQKGDDWSIPVFNVGTAPLHIGQLGYPGYNYWINCYLEDLRFTKNLARYTENFIPPEAPSSKEILHKTYLHKENEQLFCEIENWDQANKSIQLWTKVPRVLYNQPTEILLYFDSTQEDNNYYIGDTGEGAAQKVWDDNFIAVYHMSQDPSVGGACILDSTKNKNHSTPVNMICTDTTNTIIGKGLNFNGANKVLYALKNKALPILTVEALSYNYDNTGGTILSNFNYSGGNFNLENNATVYYATIDNTTGYTESKLYNNNTYYFSTFTYDGIIAKYYNNGDYIGDMSKTATSTTTNTWLIGASSSSTTGTTRSNYFNGIIKEVRLSNSIRSKSWIKANNALIFDELLTIIKAPIYQISGYITSNNQPAQRQVFLYERTSGELVDKGISTAEGYYSLKTPFSGEHNIVCLDDPYDVDLDDLILSKVIPTEVI